VCLPHVHTSLEKTNNARQEGAECDGWRWMYACRGVRVHLTRPRLTRRLSPLQVVIGLWDEVEAFLAANPDIAQAHHAQATLNRYRHMGNKRAYGNGARYFLPIAATFPIAAPFPWCEKFRSEREDSPFHRGAHSVLASKPPPRRFRLPPHGAPKGHPAPTKNLRGSCALGARGTVGVAVHVER
jgi:hypothetical protein